MTDKVALINRLDCIKANCEISIEQKQPMTNDMLKLIVKTMVEMKQFILDKSEKQGG